MKPAMTLVLMAFCLSGNEPVFAQDTSATQPATVVEHRWVGLTTTMTDGSIESGFGLLQGHSAMHSICANEVAPNVRACFTSEIVGSVVTGRLEAIGWVIPTGYALHRNPSATAGGEWFAQDTATGITGTTVGDPSEAYRSLSCGGFLDDETSGIVANASGFLQLSCGSRHAISCCAPMAIPVSR